MRRPAARAARGPSPSEEVTPQTYPETTPPPYARHGQDVGVHVLQAVFEMQNSIGELTAKVDRLISDVRSHGEKIDSVRMRLAWLAGSAAAVGALATLALAALRVLPSSWFK